MNKKKSLYLLFIGYCYQFQIKRLLLLIAIIANTIFGLKYITCISHAYTITTPNNPSIFIGTDIKGDKIIQVVPPISDIEQQPTPPLIIIPKVSVPWEPTAPTVKPLDTITPATPKVQSINPMKNE